MRPTDYVTVTFEGLGKGATTFVLSHAAGKRMKDFIAARTKPAGKEKTVPARQVLPELIDDALRPATMLRGARYKASLTQKILAGRLGILQHHLSEMENGKRPIGRQMAKRLAKVMQCDYRLFV